jgi:hypothetical protein
VVWLDANTVADGKQGIHEDFTDLRRVADHLKLFNDSEQCIEYITKIKLEKVFLIVSGSLSETVIPLTHTLPQIAGIFIYCCDIEYHRKWSESFNAIRGVYTELASICADLEKITSYSASELIGINYASGFSSVTASAVQTIAAIKHHHQEANFMYSELMKDILIKFPSTPRCKKEMINYCLLEYMDNCTQQRVIQEFNNTYTKEKVIMWYSRDCFLYRLLNKALREQDVDALYKMRYFIRELNQQIQREHRQWLRRTKVKLLMYIAVFVCRQKLSKN